MHVCTVVVACKEKEGVVIYLGVRKQEACKSSSNSQMSQPTRIKTWRATVSAKNKSPDKGKPQRTTAQ